MRRRRVAKCFERSGKNTCSTPVVNWTYHRTGVLKMRKNARLAALVANQWNAKEIHKQVDYNLNRGHCLYANFNAREKTSSFIKRHRIVFTFTSNTKTSSFTSGLFSHSFALYLSHPFYNLFFAILNLYIFVRISGNTRRDWKLDLSFTFYFFFHFTKRYRCTRLDFHRYGPV